MEKILDVQRVHLAIRKTNPPQLRIVADGTARSPGYTAPTLIPYMYVTPPADGIYDFDFVATPPEGFVPQVLAPITAEHTLEAMPQPIYGVRIHASSNAIVSLVGEPSPKPKVVCINGTLTDDGVECQALRGEDGGLYTLVGDLGEFKNGDEVCVCGTIAELSVCMQGTTIAVSWIGAAPPRAGTVHHVADPELERPR